MTEPVKIAVIGAGISGLACANRLLELKAKHGAPLTVHLFEKNGRTGGTIETLKQDGFTLEAGPDAFVSEKPWALDLAKRLKIEDEVIGTQDENRKSFVLRRGKLIPLPEGFYLIAPTRASAFLCTPLFSPLGKMRMMFELFLPRRRGDSDESVGSFIRRRLGREALERVGQPMLAGIYTGDPEKLSLAATLPRFRELEKKYGSLIRGLLSAGKNKATQARGPRYSLFLSFKNGMETLTKKLTQSLAPGTLRLNSAVREVSRGAAGGPWTLTMATGEQRAVDAVCLTVPASAAALFLKNSAPSLSEKLGAVTFESVATVNLAYKREQISHPLDGFGFVVPRTENSALVACSFTSQKYAGRAPVGTVLLRAFTGGAFGKDFLELTDAELVLRIQSELSAVLGIRGTPIFSLVRRYPGSMVQYRVGHLDWVKQTEEELSAYPGLFLTGSSYRGVGIPDCIRDAELQAEKIFDVLTASP